MIRNIARIGFSILNYTIIYANTLMVVTIAEHLFLMWKRTLGGRNLRKHITIFISYAHKDGPLCEELDKQLSWLKRSKGIKVWDDRSIHIGVYRQQEINRHLNTAQIILLLISPDFMASERCYTEMKRAMERHEAGE